MVAGRDDVGLNNVIKSRRPLRAVARDRIIATRGSIGGPHCADGDHIRIVAGRGDGPVAMRASTVIATLIAGGSDYYDPRFPGQLDCLAERIKSVAFIDLSTE